MKKVITILAIQIFILDAYDSITGLNKIIFCYIFPLIMYIGLAQKTGQLIKRMICIGLKEKMFLYYSIVIEF